MSKKDDDKKVDLSEMVRAVIASAREEWERQAAREAEQPKPN